MPQMDFCNTIRVEPDGRRGVKLAFDPTETLAAPEHITLNVPLEVVGARLGRTSRHIRFVPWANMIR
jgi:hypothetical protein